MHTARLGGVAGRARRGRWGGGEERPRPDEARRNLARCRGVAGAGVGGAAGPGVVLAEAARQVRPVDGGGAMRTGDCR